MKKLLALLIAVLTVFSSVAVFAADITVAVNGEEVAFDAKPYEQDGEVFIPFRFVAEKLGAIVSWDGETKTVFTVLGDSVSTMQIGNSKVFTEKENLTAAYAPSILEDRTFVTKDIIEFALKVKVAYDKASSAVTITK